MLKTKSARQSFVPIIVVGLPVLLLGWLVLSLLFSPLRTSQKKGNDSQVLNTASIAQSFRAEYSNLSKIYVKFNGFDPANRDFVVSLHRGALDGPVIARWSDDYFALTPDALQAYEFDVQPDSAGQLYFLKMAGNPTQANLSTATLAASKQEAYPEGQLYLNDLPTQGDLFFIAEYQPNLSELIRGFFEQQNRFGGFPALALLCLLLAFILAGMLLGLMAKQRNNLVRLLAKSGKRPWLIFGGLLLALRLMLSLSFMLITPPLQGPDEPGHIGRALGLAEGKSGNSYTAPVADLMQRTNFIERFPWLTYADNPVELYPPDIEQRQPPFYYGIAAGLVKLGGIFGADFSAQNYLVRLASVLMGLIMVAAALALGYLWRTESVGLALALPISAALLPEAIHLSGVANNDNGAIAFGAVAAWGMALLLLRGPRPLYFVILALGLGLSIFSKASTNALLPGYAIGLYLLAWINLPQRWVRRALIFLPFLLFILGGLALFVLTDHERAATAWYQTPTLDTGKHAERTALAGAHSGKYVLKLTGPDNAVEQQANLFNQADFQQVQVSGWLRAEGDSSAIIRLQTVTKTLSEQRFNTGPEWKQFSLQVAVNSAEISHTRLQTYLRLQLASTGSGTLYLDDLSLAPTDKPDVNLLANPSFEDTLWTLQSDWSGKGRTARSFSADLLDAAQNGADLDLGSIFLQNWLFLFVTFWGAFGWSQVLFNPVVYLVGGIVFLLALVGLLRRQAWKFSAGGRAFAIFSLVSFLTTAFALQFIRLPTSWMYIGTPDLTHSRHAFAALLPQLFILLVGLRGLRNFRILPRRAKPEVKKDAIIAQEKETIDGLENSAVGSLWLPLWVWSVFLFTLTLAALLSAIFPFYYNS